MIKLKIIKADDKKKNCNEYCNCNNTKEKQMKKINLQKIKFGEFEMNFRNSHELESKSGYFKFQALKKDKQFFSDWYDLMFVGADPSSYQRTIIAFDEDGVEYEMQGTWVLKLVKCWDDDDLCDAMYITLTYDCIKEKIDYSLLKK